MSNGAPFMTNSNVSDLKLPDRGCRSVLPPFPSRRRSPPAAVSVPPPLPLLPGRSRFRGGLMEGMNGHGGAHLGGGQERERRAERERERNGKERASRWCRRQEP